MIYVLQHNMLITITITIDRIVIAVIDDATFIYVLNLRS